MRVLFDTYPWAFVAPGGGERQLLEYAKNLPGHGVEVVLHDHWNWPRSGNDHSYDRQRIVSKNPN